MRVCVSASAAGQRGGGAGALWVRGRSASDTHQGFRRMLDDRESRTAFAAAVCMSAMPQVKWRLPTTPQLNATTAACLPTGDLVTSMIRW